MVAQRRSILKNMDEQQAKRAALAHLHRRGYHGTEADQLSAERFAAGWSFRLPTPPGLERLSLGRMLVLVGDDGSVEESEVSLFAGVAEARFTARRS